MTQDEVTIPVVIVREKHYSVTEIFGPTMQGEGPMAGARTFFLRLHFCDGDGHKHWCKWCDTRYTWDHDDPAFKEFKTLTATQIVSQLHQRGARLGDWVTISGGNPVMQLDEELVNVLGDQFKLQLETQGTIWKPCLFEFDRIVISPKPPSSGLDSLEREQVEPYVNYGVKQLRDGRQRNLDVKIVVFDKADFNWAVEFVEDMYRIARQTREFRPEGRIGVYLQAGTEVEGNVADVVLEKYKWLVETWLESGHLKEAKVLPQIHALVWGRRKGV